MWTLPNIITIVRISFTPVIALLPFIEGYWPKLVCFVVFVIAAVSDVFDGYLARRQQPGHRPGQAARPHRRQAAALRHAGADLLDLAHRATTCTTFRSGAVSRSGYACS